jgi:hypothetical protein
MVSFILYVTGATRVPDWLLHRLLVNNAISAVVGFVPIVGDIGIAVFKANSRNAALLEEFLRIRGSEALKVQSQGPAALQENPKDIKPGAGSGSKERLNEKSGASSSGMKSGSGSVSGGEQRKRSWFS